MLGEKWRRGREERIHGVVKGSLEQGEALEGGRGG